MAETLRKLAQFSREVWRRRVLQVAIPYGVVAWLLVQVLEIVFDAFETPAWVMQGFLTLLVLGFPVAVFLAWVFDITPKGSVVRTAPIEDEATEEPVPAPAVSLEMGDAERRRVTILSCSYEFMDGGEGEADPESLQEAHTALQEKATELSLLYEAFQIPGGAQDLTLAFGYPQAHEGDARRAVASGLNLIAEIENRPEFKTPKGKPRFFVRAGVATGLVVVDESHGPGKAVTFIGQVPRLASWLTGLAEPGTLLVGPKTRKLVKNQYQLEPQGIHSAAQSSERIAVYRVDGAAVLQDLSTSDLPLVAREDEMRLLQDRWDNVTDGEGQFIVLSGEMGIGKSSLVRAFRQQVSDRGGATIIPCQCSPYERHNPLSPLIHLLQGPVLQFNEQDTSETRLQKLVRFMERQSVDSAEAVPLLASLLSLDTGEEFRPPSVSAQVIRMQTLQLLLDMIVQAAARNPVLMVLEDLHWADPTTLEMVRMMIDRGPERGLLILFSTRPEFSTDWMNRSIVLVHKLLPLGRKDALKLVRSTQGAVEFPDSIVERIISETDGNPLYIQELTRAVLESDAWRIARKKGNPAAMTWLAIPATLQDSLAARVDNLGKEKALLQLCSVLGREFSYDLLRVVSETENESALKEELSRLVKAELLFQRGLFHNLTYTFKHILIQETAYNSLLKSKRRELHEKTAGVLESGFPEVAKREPSLLAWHYGKAQDPQKAITYWTLAGRQSLGRFANQEAIEQSLQGLELIESTPESSQRAAIEIPLQSVLGTALLSSHGYAHPEVRKVFTRALALCEQIGDAPQLFQVGVGLWMYYTIASRLDEALDLSQRLVRIAKTTNDPVQFLQARYCLAFVLYYRADFLAARAYLEAALESEVEGCDYSAQSPSGDDTRIHVRVILAHVYWHFGLNEDGERLVREANAIASERKHPWGIVFATFQSAWYHQMRAEPAKALKYAAAAIGIAVEKGFGFWLPLLNVIVAWGETRRAEHSMAPVDRTGVERMSAGLEKYRGIGSGAGVSCCLFMLAEDYIWLGEYERAVEELESARVFLRETGEDFFEPEYYRLHGRIHLQRFHATQDLEELDEAALLFKQSLTRARRLESRALELRTAPYRAEALALQGKMDSALQILTEIIQRTTGSSSSNDWIHATEVLRELEGKAG